MSFKIRDADGCRFHDLDPAQTVMVEFPDGYRYPCTAEMVCQGYHMQQHINELLRKYARTAIDSGSTIRYSQSHRSDAPGDVAMSELETYEYLAINGRTYTLSINDTVTWLEGGPLDDPNRGESDDFMNVILDEFRASFDDVCRVRGWTADYDRAAWLLSRHALLEVDVSITPTGIRITDDMIPRTRAHVADLLSLVNQVNRPEFVRSVVVDAIADAAGKLEG